MTYSAQKLHACIGAAFYSSMGAAVVTCNAGLDARIIYQVGALLSSCIGNGQTYATRGVPYYRVSRISASPSTETSVCKQSGLVVYVWAVTFQFFPCLHFFPSPLSFPLLFILLFSTFCLPRIGTLAEEASFDLYPTLCFKKIRRVSPKIRKGRPTSHWNFRRSVS